MATFRRRRDSDRTRNQSRPEKDHIKVHGKLVNTKLQNRNAYILVNKPKGYLSSAADPEGRKLVVDLVKGYGRLHPVGHLVRHQRLDHPDE